MRITEFSLYLITDRHLTGGRPLTEIVRHALEGGVRAVQLREKDLSGAELYRLAADLRRLTSDYNARLIINDRSDVALATDADGVHLGVNSLPVAAVRQIMGTGKIIGYSAHTIDEARRAEDDGADFVTYGPLYATPSKAAYGAPCGVKELTDAASALDIPVIALGGISAQNITEALSAKIQGIAVISAVMASADPRGTAAFLMKKIEEYAQLP